MRSDEGAAAVEFMAWIGFVLGAIFCSYEAYTAFATVEQVENATRTGARVASMHGVALNEPTTKNGPGTRAAQAALPDVITDSEVTVEALTGDAVRCTVRAKVPLIADGLHLNITVRRRVEMPVG
ncbi:hypothetical protein GCM10009678_50830 [Actinomadura kijaniata]|uniref:Flp pilus assembly protein TadG n=1 Tax=Actinomadura namibiensis TaxID=182080 RepID=A0A7W3LI29_ACTNM|nr:MULTISPECIES: hypothetical protein [Actinomadura]MBA8948547.1 Flp pilus assembly protein TadG [Actinomadura namibiensis]